MCPRHLVRLPTAAALVLLLALAPWPLAAHADAGFRQWIEGFYPQARQAGISRSTYQAVFKNVSEPDPEVLAAARYQPEFVTPVWDYLNTRVTADAIRRGREMARQYRQWLDRIEAKYGVDRYILLAIWSMESSYGAALKRHSVLRGVIRSLATLAYADPRREKFARRQLIAAMRIVQSGDITVAGLRGSWAGAMGHTQFIPTSYEHWAVDIDGDGKRDVWNSPPDALASAANLLADNGWRSGKTWGYEVKLPADFDYARIEQEGIRLRRWAALGVQRVNGSPFSDPGDQAILKMPAGARGPAFLMLKNFFVLKRYNNADQYALAVGYLADRLKGGPALSTAWPRDAAALNSAERRELQTRLSKLGLYTGAIDGAIGPISRASIRQYQIQNGLRVDGFASASLLNKLRGMAAERSRTAAPADHN